MKLIEYADTINEPLVLLKLPRVERWMCKFDNCEVKEGRSLRTERGEGKSPAEAMGDYAKKIRGGLLVFDSRWNSRREQSVGTDLE